MKLSRYASIGLAVAGSIALGSLAIAAGLWPGFPVVGGATYCAGSSSSATGTIIGVVTGCPNQVPAGPTIVTGNERIPADTQLASGVNPQTILLSMASLNALPITWQTVAQGAVNTTDVSAANTVGGIYYRATYAGTSSITAVNVTLPTSPIDGQQFALSSNRSVTTVNVTAGGSNSMCSNTAPTAITASLTAPQGYRFIYNLAATCWGRLQ